MKPLIPALIAGVLICGSVQAEVSLSERLERANRAHQESLGLNEEAELRRAQLRLVESQLRRESNQQMRDDLIIMDSLNRQLRQGIAPIAPLPGLPRPGLVH
jgi:hypothetical protein